MDREEKGVRDAGVVRSVAKYIYIYIYIYGRERGGKERERKIEIR